MVTSDMQLTVVVPQKALKEIQGMILPSNGGGYRRGLEFDPAGVGSHYGNSSPRNATNHNSVVLVFDLRSFESREIGIGIPFH